MSRDLRARGFRFVGPTICYALMQSAGLVNDHETRLLPAARRSRRRTGTVRQLRARQASRSLHPAAGLEDRARVDPGADTNSTQIAATITTIDGAISHGSIAPSAVRSGTTIGAAGGKNVSTRARTPSGRVTSRIEARR